VTCSEASYHGPAMYHIGIALRRATYVYFRDRKAKNVELVLETRIRDLECSLHRAVNDEKTMNVSRSFKETTSLFYNRDSFV
jgi:hypothetical protein